MDKQHLLITPQTRVGDLIRVYPELEGILVEVAPAFRKLQNRVLRRTVARVTSLAQAARAGNVSVVELVRRLRREVGQPDFDSPDEDERAPSRGVERPAWLDERRVVETLDVRSMIESGNHPIGDVFAALGRMGRGEILKLITPFDPAPLIDKVAAKGYVYHQMNARGDKVVTYFTRQDKENESGK